MMAVARMSQRARQSHMRHANPRLTEMTYMDERLLPVMDELAQVPPIPVDPSATETKPAQNEAPKLQPGAAILHRSRCTYRLELTLDDSEKESPTDPVVDLVVTDPESKVLEIQRFVRALTLNDKTRHHEAPGR